VSPSGNSSPPGSPKKIVETEALITRRLAVGSVPPGGSSSRTKNTYIRYESPVGQS